jgi:uncharacterized protein (DUF1697 family)
MQKYVAFLRAINVGGRFIKMAALAEHFHALGYADAQTFINSGNVIFSAVSRAPNALARAIESNIEPLLGFKSEVFVRSADELHAVLAQAARLLPQVPAGGELNVVFLAAPLGREQTASLIALRSATDDFVVLGQEAYWLCRVAQSESKFSNAVMERKLLLRTTFRRHSMLLKLAAQHLT